MTPTQIILLLGLVALLAFAYRAKQTQQETEKALQPVLDTGQILTWGWSEVELTKILADFISLYRQDHPNFTEQTFALTPAADDAMSISWTHAIYTDHVQFLVNYLHYPEHFDFDQKSRCAVGVIPVVEGPGCNETAPGTLAKLYVPEADDKFDEVFAQLPNGQAYRVSFRNHRWAKIDEPRDNERVRSAPWSASV